MGARQRPARRFYWGRRPLQPPPLPLQGHVQGVGGSSASLGSRGCQGLRGGDSDSEGGRRVLAESHSFQGAGFGVHLLWTLTPQ